MGSQNDVGNARVKAKETRNKSSVKEAEHFWKGEYEHALSREPPKHLSKWVQICEAHPVAPQSTSCAGLTVVRSCKKC